ncbi:MAG: HD domain-containing phosphohydrolase [Gaiellales bacterium]
MWGLGALLLFATIGLSRQADSARQRELVIANMRQTTVSAPWIAFNGTGASPAVVGEELSGVARSLESSAEHLRALGDSRYPPRIEAAIGGAIASSQEVARLSAAHDDTSAVGVANRSITAGGRGAALWSLFDRASASYRGEGDRAERWGSITSVLLALIMLLAFSIALHRSLRARRRAELLSSDKQALLEQSQVEATTDALTGMPNRRALFDDADALLRSLSEGAELSLGIYDLDGFKLYNDSFGHPAGDALLAHLGHQLMLAVLDCGSAYRMGGDEFCVITTVPDSERVHAAAAIALSEHGERFAIGCSYGVASIPLEAPSLEQALQIADRRLYGNKELRRSSQSLQIKDALIQLLAEQSGDLVTHLSRVATLAVETAERLELPVDEIARIRLAAELHDVGKAAVPRVILEKTGRLDATELAYLRHHSVIGERILAAAPALANIAPLVRATHERPDGTGYPDRLRLEQIPIGSRVIAVVDAFDAMTASRPYQHTKSVDQALIELERGAGTQFDAAIVEVFLAVIADRDSESWRKLRGRPEKEDVRPVPASLGDGSPRPGSDRRANRS